MRKKQNWHWFKCRTNVSGKYIRSCFVWKMPISSFVGVVVVVLQNVVMQEICFVSNANTFAPYLLVSTNRSNVSNYIQEIFFRFFLSFNQQNILFHSNGQRNWTNIDLNAIQWGFECSFNENLTLHLSFWKYGASIKNKVNKFSKR